MLGDVIAAGITPSAAVPPTTATPVGAAAGKPPVRYTMRSTPARLVAMVFALVVLALNASFICLDPVFAFPVQGVLLLLLRLAPQASAFRS